MNQGLPKDPMILLSYVNTMLRDNFASLKEFCDANDFECEDIISKLSAVGFDYDEQLNQFR